MTEQYEKDEREFPSLVDASRLRDLPTTARGQRTRDTLVTAARRVFERDGFINSRLTDITAEAKVSIGTFYTYFDTKEEVFAAVMQAAQDDMMHPGLPHVEDDPENIASLLEASVRAYLLAYQRNAKLMLLLEQVATIDDDFRRLRIARSEAFADRNARRISWMQSNGLADTDLDPAFTSRALSTIVSRMAYYAFALGTGGDIDELAANITRLWLGALGNVNRPS